jgi:hypothetical protein
MLLIINARGSANCITLARRTGETCLAREICTNCRFQLQQSLESHKYSVQYRFIKMKRRIFHHSIARKQGAVTGI